MTGSRMTGSKKMSAAGGMAGKTSRSTAAKSEMSGMSGKSMGEKGGMSGKSGMSSKSAMASMSGKSGMSEMSGSASMTEKELLNDLLNQQKQLAGIYAMSITECSRPDLRQVLTQQHSMICQDQFQVFTQMNQRGYYKTKSAPVKEISTAKSNYSQVKTTMS